MQFPETLLSIFCKQSVHCVCVMFAQKSLEFFREKGFDSLPQVLVNGGQVDMEEVCVYMCWEAVRMCSG